MAETWSEELGYKYCRCLISGWFSGVKVDWQPEEIERHAQTDKHTQTERNRERQTGE